MTWFFAGVDLGQRRDYTAIAVVERSAPEAGLDWMTYERQRLERFSVRYLERVRLGTSYLDVVERVQRVVQAREIAGRCTLVVDATGVGGPVVDLLRAAQLGCELKAVTITGGDRESGSGGAWRVPKRDLISRLQVMFEQKQLQIADRLAEAQTLARELMNMQMHISAEGHDSYGARQEKVHDDLVLAVALACWQAKGPMSRPAYGTKKLGIEY